MWWRWSQWVLVGLFVASWIPSAVNTRLAWLWMGTLVWAEIRGSSLSPELRYPAT